LVEGRSIGVDLGVQLEKRFVNAAQLLGAEVPVIDRSTNLAFEGESEGSDGF
jgi:hypothetical protein